MDYTIQKNDSLSKIAQLNNTDVATLVKLNNIKNPNLIQSGSTLKLPTVTPAVNTQQTTITSSSLQPQTKIEIPAPTPTTETPAPTQNLASSFLDELALTQNEKSAQAGQENLIAKMLENITNQSGESAYKTELIKGSGIDTLRKDLQGINSQILKKQAEIAQDDIQLISNMRAEERRDTLLPFAQMGQAKLAGDAQILRALKTSEIGVLNAVALGKQGDIALAKDLVNEAVDAKYAPYKEQNAIYEAQLKAIQPFLTSAEKKQATAQQFKITQATKELDKVSEFQKTILSNAISSNAPQSVINAISKGQSIEEITKAGAGYLKSKSDILAERLKQLQINELQKKVSDTTGVTAKDLPLILKSAEDKIGKIQGLIENKKGLTASSGILLRKSGLSSKIRDWRADVRNVLSDLTVDELGRVKASGVTFGALSEGERKAVGDAASALNAAARTDSDGKLTGYFDISEDKVKQELQTIQDYAKIDFERRVGMKYDDYTKLKSEKPTEETYAESLLNSSSSSPFNIFEQ